MKKICVWMNIPSHHQHFFFEALDQRADTDLAVCYYDPALAERRRAQGWVVPERERYARFVDVAAIADPELRDHIHIIPTFDARVGGVLAESAVRCGLKWCHWGERFGAGLAAAVGYDMRLFHLLNPVLGLVKLYPRIRAIRRHALLALAQGELAARDLRGWGISPQKIRHLSYSVPALPAAGRLPELERFKNGRMAFLCVASLCRRKGIDLLLRAYAGLSEEERRRSCLVLQGGGDPEPYRSFCRKNGIDGGVFFMGACASDEIAGVYHSGDCLVLPTLHDGWGVVLNEAASVGLPLISTDECGAAWHLLRDGANGFRVRANDAAALREAMRRYIADPRLLDRHGATSKDIFSGFTPEAMAERLLGYLGEAEKR